MEDFVFSDTLQVSLCELIDDLMSEFDLQLAVSCKEAVKSGTVEREFDLFCGVIVWVSVLGEAGHLRSPWKLGEMDFSQHTGTW